VRLSLAASHARRRKAVTLELASEPTRHCYAMYADMNEPKNEGDRVVGDGIAEEGKKFLQIVNFGANARTIKIAAE